MAMATDVATSFDDPISKFQSINTRNMSTALFPSYYFYFFFHDFN